MDRKAIKAKAKEFAFSHKWAIWKPILVGAIIVGLVSGVLSAIFGIDSTQDTNGSTVMAVIANALLCFIGVGQVYYIRKVINGKEVSIKEDLFHFTPNYIGILIPCVVYLVATNLTEILGFVLPTGATWVALVTLVAAVAQIIFSFMFVMTQLVLAEDKKENYGGITALLKSKDMMNGYKWDYFCLMFSFIGWFILCIFIIPIIWVVPWVQATHVMYYEELQKVQK